MVGEKHVNHIYKYGSFTTYQQPKSDNRNIGPPKRKLNNIQKTLKKSWWIDKPCFFLAQYEKTFFGQQSTLKRNKSICLMQVKIIKESLHDQPDEAWSVESSLFFKN